jgi:hypothetical protein
MKRAHAVASFCSFYLYREVDPDTRGNTIRDPSLILNYTDRSNLRYGTGSRQARTAGERESFQIMPSSFPVKNLGVKKVEYCRANGWRSPAEF